MHSYVVPPEVKQRYRDQYNPWSPTMTSKIAYSYAASALLAIDHFNDRHHSIVPELKDLADDDCTVYFPEPKYGDSQSDGGNSIKALWEMVGNREDRFHPCAILGPLHDKATMDMRSSLAALDIPLLAHYIENDILAMSQSESPGTISMTLSAPGRARAMVEYLQSREYLNLASWRSSFSLDQDTLLAETLERIGEEMFGLKVALFVDVQPPADVEDEAAFVRKNLQQLKDNGITTIFLTSVREPHNLPNYAIYLEQLNMLTNDYFYILPPMLVPPIFGNATVNSAIDALYGELVPDSPLDKLL